MTDFLLILGITVLLNVFVTLFILNKYTLGLMEESDKMFDRALDAMRTTMEATFEVRKQIFKELDKLNKD